MSGTVALITGGSRGIGAETARILARRGSDLVITFRSKEGRAFDVAAEIGLTGRKCVAIRADFSLPEDIRNLAEGVRSEFGRVDHLILNAAGGLERDRDDAYAYALNVTANEQLVGELLPAMPAGGSIVYVTSHPSHFYGVKPIMVGYQRVASTKKAAEDMLRARIPELAKAGVRLAVVSGDLIEGTINAKLMQREYPNLLTQRVQEVGRLPSVAEFAMAIADAAADGSLETGATILIGSTAWDTYDAVIAREKALPPPILGAQE